MLHRDYWGSSMILEFDRESLGFVPLAKMADGGAARARGHYMCALMCPGLSSCRYVLFVLMVAILALVAAGAAAAQQVADPSKIEEQFEERSVPRSDVIIRVPDSAAAKAGRESDVRFTLRDVSVEGVTVLSQAQLSAVYGRFLGQEISVIQLFEFAENLTALYRNSGYILSRVVVPAQEIPDGVARLVAVEGRIGEVRVEGDLSIGGRLVAHMAEKIRSSVPLQAKVMERYMLLINDLPGIEAQAVLKASQTQGATDLTILVEERRSSHYLVANNRGSKFNGPIQLQHGSSFHGLFGMPGKTSVRLIGSGDFGEFQFYQLAHEQPLGSEGTTLSVAGRYSRSRPGSDLADLDIDSRSYSGQVVLRHPIIRTRAKTLYARAGMRIRNTDAETLGEPLSEDKLRVAFVGGTYDFVDSADGINLIDLEVSKGLDILSATQNGASLLSRADAETGFLKVNLSAMRLQRIAKGVSLLVDVIGQFSSDGLAAAEEIAIGGTTYGRAFDPAEITGERGLAGRLELRYDGAVAGGGLLNRYQLYGFADYGTVWDRNPDGGYTRTDLASAGGGVRLTFTKNLSGYAEIAVPTKRTPDYIAEWGNSARAFVGLTLRF